MNEKIGSLKKEILQEIDPILTALTIGTLAVAVRLFGILAMYISAWALTKIDKNLTKLLNDKLSEFGIKGAGNYSVRIMKEKAPNAFALMTPTVFVTQGLLKFTDDEIMAVMLHEVNHIKNLDLIKRELTDYTFCYIMAGIVVSTGEYMVDPVLAALLFISLLSISEISYNVTIGRMHEIQSDVYAAKFGYSDALISALKKIDKYYKSRYEDTKFSKMIRKLDELLDEHPTLQTRIEEILKQKELTMILISRSYKRLVEFIGKGFGIPDFALKIKNKIF